MDGRGTAAGGDARDVTGSTTEMPGAPRGTQDRVFGVLAGLMILTAIVLLVNSLVGSPPVTDSAPRLELVSPVDGDSLSLPIEVRFRSAEPLSMQPGGWGARNFHLHIEAAGAELMPGPTDIRPASTDEYIWTIPNLPFGKATLRLFWADAAHRPVTDGASNSASIVIR